MPTYACSITDFPEEQVWIYLCDVPAQSIAEYGRILPEPGAETAWEAALPEPLQHRLRSAGRRPDVAKSTIQ